MTPSVTLHGTLTDISGAPAAGYVVITLINYGAYPPNVAGTSLLSLHTQTVQANPDGTWSATLWGNDQITPANTLYEINIGGVAAKYRLNSGSYDLSELTPATKVYSGIIVQVLGGSGEGMVITVDGNSL